jgi:hypothetical protein
MPRFVSPQARKELSIKGAFDPVNHDSKKNDVSQAHTLPLDLYLDLKHR